MTPTCKGCGQQHYNFKSCGQAMAEREEKAMFDMANLRPTLGSAREGWHPLKKNELTNVRLHGGMQVIKSGLQREGWKEVGS